jgi:hypothetical protein
MRFNHSISAITKVFARRKAAKMVAGSIMAWSAFGKVVNSGVEVPPIQAPCIAASFWSSL